MIQSVLCVCLNHTAPPWLSGHCANWASGYSALITWNKPDGVWTYVRVNMTDQSHLLDGTLSQVVINGLQPAQTYEVSLVSLSGDRSSDPSVFLCDTDNKGE